MDVLKCEQCNKTYKSQKFLDLHKAKCNKDNTNDNKKTNKNETNDNKKSNKNETNDKEKNVLNIESSYKEEAPENAFSDEMLEGKVVPLKEYITLVNEINEKNMLIKKLLNILMKDNSIFRTLKFISQDQVINN